MGCGVRSWSRLVSLTVTVGLLLAVPALAAWIDVDPAVLTPYGLTEAHLEAVSDGYPDGTWRPYDPMTRRQFAKIAAGVFELTPVSPEDPIFPDVPRDDASFPYVEAGAAVGLLKGFVDGRFHPDLLMTREQAAAVIARYLAWQLSFDLASRYPPAVSGPLLQPFGDSGEISPRLVAEMALAVDEDIVRGSTGGLLSPRSPVTRIAGTALLVRGEETLSSSTTTTSSSTTSTTTEPSPSPSAFLASLHFAPNETVFPVQGSGIVGASAQPRLFNTTQDGNGDGAIDPEDALQNIIRWAIGPGVTGSGRTGLPDRGPNDQVPAVYVHQVTLGGAFDGWTVYEYWLYYADNPGLPRHEHDWEAYFVYVDPGGTPRSFRLSAHDVYRLYSWSALQGAGRLDGTHPLLSVEGGSHAFLAPDSPLADGVRIGWDGSVARRAGLLEQGDGTSPGWLVLSNDGAPGTHEFTAAPDAYYYGDPYFSAGSELGDPRESPWLRSQWLLPPPPR